MPKMTRIEVLQRSEQPTLGIRVQTNLKNLPQQIGECYEKLGQYLQELGEYSADIPYVLYHSMDMQHLDVEMGFPVTKVYPEKGDMKPGIIPAGHTIFCVYRGPYTGMTELYQEMMEWIPAHGFEATGKVFEYYYNDPADFPESELLTKVVMPVNEKK